MKKLAIGWDGENWIKIRRKKNALADMALFIWELLP